jgi:soluble cytochrome b562
MAEQMLVRRLTAGELHDLQEGLDVYAEERLDSYRKWLKLGSRGEAVFALKDFRRVRRLFRTIEKRAAREATP